MINVFTDTFQVLVSFENLDLLENQQIAKKALYGLSGIYGFVHIPTGTSYIGSSIDVGGRIMDHILNNSSNLHLQNAIVKYGLSHFAFVILEYCIPSDIIKREQHFLDILFSLAKTLRYNFSPTADSPLGVVRSEETRAKMSEAKTGNTHTPETRAQMSDSKSGANNPMFGKFGITPPHAMTVNVFHSLDNVLVRSFSSQVAVAKWLGINQSTVSRYIKSGKLWNNQYRFVKSMS